MISVLRGVANSIADGFQLILDDVDDAGARRQDLEIVFDFECDLVQLFRDFIAAQSRQAGKAQFKDRLGLLFGQSVGIVLSQLVARIGDQLDQRRHVLGGPIAPHQLFLGLGRRCRVADQLDDFVDVGDRDRQADQYVGTVARLGQQVLDAPRHDILAEGREGADHIDQRQAFGPAAVDRQHVGAERRLQIGVLVEVVQHDVGNRIALQLDDDANAFAVGLVPDIRDAFDLLVAHQIGDLLDQDLLVDLIGDLR